MGGKRLTKQDWVTAALTMIAERGVAALAVEPLAARLGATKGSAYWHFPNREALLRAALDDWAREKSDRVTVISEENLDPAAGLWRIFDRVVVDGSANDLEYAMTAAIDDVMVAPVVHDVTARRVAYLASMFTRMGYDPDAARMRAQHVHGFLLGHVQLVRSGADVGDPMAYAKSAYHLLTSR